MAKILVLSPHLDDAALCCTDHIIQWNHQHNETIIITIFTSFKTCRLSEDTKRFLNDSGVHTPTELEIARKREDNHVMKELQIKKIEYLNFIDGGFRCIKNELIYPTHIDLFSSHISPFDQKIMNMLKDRLKKYQYIDRVVVPFGIGNHADHLITRLSAESVFPRHHIAYYIDYPYALKRTNWNFRNIAYVIAHSPSLKWTSEKKQNILSQYKSQMPTMFRYKPNYPEIICS